MTKQKIVFLHPDLGIGGAERLVIDAAMELSRFGYEARVISRLQSLLT
jgi:alpha-1,3/alpha-1,6-mannosyltransferase